MAILATPKKFSMQQAFEILLRKPVDKSIVAYLTDTKTTGLENTLEMVYPTGGAGNVYIGGGFGHSRRATFNVTVATFNTDVLAIQNGTEVKRGNTNITYYDIMSVETDGTVNTKFKAIGATGSEISYIYKLNSDGTYGAVWEQAATASDGKFAYATATKTITFSDEDANKPVKGDILACAYTYATADNAQKITVNSDGIPPTVLVSAYGLAKDVCNGELFPCVLEGQAQVDGNWNFDVSADGEPVVQNLKMEFVRGCLDKKLYDFTVFTEDEATTP